MESAAALVARVYLAPARNQRLCDAIGARAAAAASTRAPEWKR